MIRLCTFPVLTAILLFNNVCAQSEAGVEQYYLRGSNKNYIVMPVLHFQNAKKWYAEARYNYEDEETASLFFGKTFSKENTFSYSFTPILGGSVGRFNGTSAGLNMSLGYKDFFFSCQSQYSLSTDHYSESFSYSWSEIGYQPLSYLYTGISLQQTNLYKTAAKFELALLLGLSFKRFSLPVYCFSPAGRERYFIVGLIFEWKNL